MNNCTVDYLNHKLVTYIDESTGHTVLQDEFIEKRVTHKRANKKGMTMSKRNDYIRMQEESIVSVLDLKMWNYLVLNFKQNGICMYRSKYITITTLAEKFKVTRQKVSKFIRKCRESGFLHKQGTMLILNPFVVLPYGISDDALYQLQQTWVALND